MIFVFRWGIAVVSLAWVSTVLPAEALRVQYEGMRKTLRAGGTVEPAILNKAISDYKKIADLGICMPGLRENLASFLSLRADTHTGSDSFERASTDLERADHFLRDMLSCSPFESNQWLSLAMIDIKRNGIRKKAFEFLKLSYLTSPREGWVIERRLTFVAGMAPLVPEFLKPHVLGDIQEMRRMGGIKRRFLKRLNIKSLDEFANRLG
jgi:hypothetical protein